MARRGQHLADRPAAVARSMLLAPAIVLVLQMSTLTARPVGPLQNAGPGTATAPAGLERITINDNRTPAGRLSRGVLSLRLEARAGQWFPDGEGNPGVVVKAFAAEGGPLQIPGPLVRVPEGTEIRAVIRNRLQGDTLAIRGMYARPGRDQDAAGAVVIPPGETREMTFAAGTPGTYFYWGASAGDTPLAQRSSADTQLTGAFVVDPRNAAPAPDRVLLIGSWNNGAPLGAPGRRNRFVINGLSWPHTERLSYSVGSTARMRIINGGAGVHPMHLHGFYFNVDSRGNERADVVYAAGSSPRLVVTERTVPGSTFSLTWKPTRPGNWLFHCHDNVHLDYGGALDGRPAPPAAHQHVENHALEMMAGPVMGITVTGASAEAPEPRGARRQLRLVARVDAGGTDAEPAFGYTLDDGRNTATPPAPYLPGPTILLKRGEPASITVVNQLKEPTAVHWHGIELESYFDGVAGFAGEGRRIAPAIAPGGSFEARFTPPRSGTFIYHTHLDDTRQQQAGLSGPLVVVDSLESYDAERDIVVMVTVPRKAADSAKVLINGSLDPPVRQLRVGQRYRLRFINVHTFRPSMRMRLLRGDALLAWQSAAKDGMDLPPDQVREGPSEIQMGNGETYDFWFVPSERGDLRLDVANAGGVLLTSMPIKVS